jgi:hypothetical protein
MTPAITRSVDHQYTYEGATYPGVTGIISEARGVQFAVASYYGAKQAAEAAIDLYDKIPSLVETVGKAGAVKALAEAGTKKRDEAANLGTEIHAIADALMKGEPTPWASPLALERAQLYADWYALSGWTVRLSEAMVVFPTVGYGGTFDLLAYDRDGKTVLADLKTGKGVYREAGLQLAAYGMAPIVARPTDTAALPMVVPDRYAILHVTASGVKEIEVAVDALDRVAFGACVELYHWTKARKGRL